MPSPPAVPAPGSNKVPLPAPFDYENILGDLKYPAQEYKAFMQDGERVRMLYRAPPSTLWQRARKYLLIFIIISGMWIAFALRNADGDPVTLFLSVSVFVFPEGFTFLYLIPWLEGRTAKMEEFLFTDRQIIFCRGKKRVALAYADVTGMSGDLALYQKNRFSFLAFKTAKKLPGLSRLEMRVVPRDHPVVELLKQLNLLNEKLL